MEDKMAGKEELFIYQPPMSRDLSALSVKGDQIEGNCLSGNFPFQECNDGFSFGANVKPCTTGHAPGTTGRDCKTGGAPTGNACFYSGSVAPNQCTVGYAV
jgi:hypothetical protein